MDELDLLISKWGIMTLLQQVLVTILVLGSVSYAFNQGYELIRRIKDAISKKGPKYNNLNNEELRNQTKDLTSKIFTFIEDMEKKEPNLNRYLALDQNEEEWDKYDKQTTNYMHETMTIYHITYLPDVVRLKQEFKKHNLIDPELDSFNGLQVNSLGIKSTAAKLLELANKLP